MTSGFNIHDGQCRQMVQEIVAVSQNRMRRIVGKLGLRSTIALSEVLD